MTRVICMLLVGVALVHAQPAGDRKAAERHFRVGEKAYKAQNFAAAAQHFEAAYKELPLPQIAFSAAQAYRRQYRTDRTERRIELAQRAVELYALYLREVKTGGRVADAADNLGEMEREVAKLTASGAKSAPAVAPAAVPRTQLVIDPELAVEGGTRGNAIGEITDLPDDSAVKLVVYIDGKQVPPYQAIEVTPAPATHRIRVEAEGYEPAELVERAAENVTENVQVVLKPRPAKVRIDTEAGASIRLDGRHVATTPSGPIDVPAGTHVITIARSGRETVAREITVARGQEMTLKQSLQKTTRRKAVPWVVVAAGGAAGFSILSVVGAVVFQNQAEDLYTEIQAGNAPASLANDYDDKRARRDQLVVGAWVGGGLALALTGVAVALYVGDSPSDEGVRVVPVAGGGATGAAFSWRF